jgi:hypothetical protein
VYLRIWENGKPNAYTDFSTANRLIQSVYSEGGNRYGDAVRRCIRCDFDQREETFESDDFRQAVYQRVVAPAGGRFEGLLRWKIARDIVDPAAAYII